MRSNLGFISKKKVAREIAKIYKEHGRTRESRDLILMDYGACSALNLLCRKLNLKPMHLGKLGGGTGETEGEGQKECGCGDE